MAFPSKIICLTEESVESLYLLGKGELVCGVSEYVERPPEAKEKPRISQFVRSNFDEIERLGPDLVLGFSDIQKDVARELIGRGLNVFISNQRSLDEILDYILMLGRLVNASREAEELVSTFRQKLSACRNQSKKAGRPKVYFEEWDRPRLSCIRWVSELIEACGGKNIFSDRVGSLAREREVSDAEIIERNPDIIIGCWCGKKVDVDSFAKRPGYKSIGAVRSRSIREVSPAIFLQPGPALFLDGLDQMLEIISAAVDP